MEASQQAPRPVGDVEQKLVISGGIPLTSTARLSAPDAQAEPFPIEPISLDATAVSSTTVLYLAYGSNMSAEIVLGRRGIKPLSQINVSAPTLRLTFNIPCLPYAEPCMANVAIRKVPKSPVPMSTPPQPFGRNATGDLEWKLGLIGVVYEVTAADYAAIIKTEGGGSVYKQILVPCFPLASAGWPPVFRRPFLARTLYAPQVPADLPGDSRPRNGDDDDDDDDEGKDPTKPKMPPRWLARMLLPLARPDPDHAQPSERYLKLLTHGAAEHGLPADYRAYLAALQPYTTTSRRQELGRAVYGCFGSLVFFAIFQLVMWFADEDTGNIPDWLGGTFMFMKNLTWMLYDNGGIKVFGDGERTETKDGGVDRGSTSDEKRAMAANWRTPMMVHEEKAELMRNLV